MHELYLNNRALPLVESADLLVASKDFLHVDRIPRFNILIYVITGCIHVTEGETDYSVHPGELLILRAGVHHYGRQRITAGTKWIYAHFHLPEPKTPPSSTAAKPFAFSQELQSLKIPRFLSGDSTNNVEPELHRLIELVRQEGPFTAFAAHSQLYRILLTICQNAHRSHSKQSLGDEIAAYLQGLLDRPFSSKVLEAAFHLTYKHLEAVFKRHTGNTIQQYHTRLRITEAAKELRSTEHSIQTISFRFGFHDPLYFSRCFKKHMGYSPKRYREIQLLK